MHTFSLYFRTFLFNATANVDDINPSGIAFFYTKFGDKEAIISDKGQKVL